MGLMFNVFNELRIKEHGCLFSGMKKQMRICQLMARLKAGGKTLENLSDTSPLRVQDCDGRPPGASVMGEQKLLPSSLPEKRYPCSFRNLT